MSAPVFNKVLELFNAIVVDSKDDSLKPIFLHDIGFMVDGVLEPFVDQIKALSVSDFNKTFYAEWNDVLSRTELQIVCDAVTHYLFNFYTPKKFHEVKLEKSELFPEGFEFKIKHISAITVDELKQEVIKLVSSGIALKQSTIEDLVIIMEKYNITMDVFSHNKNKELMIVLCDRYQVVPNDPVDFLRYVVYKSSPIQSSLLIIDKQTIDNLVNNTSVAKLLESYGEPNRLATIYHRFKLLFLAMKRHNPKLINYISKQAKKLHVPMAQNPLNSVTTRLLVEEDTHWLNNATVYAIFRALSACKSAITAPNSIMTYNIRNGKSWTGKSKANIEVCSANYDILKAHLSSRADLNGKVFYIPRGIKIALPTSEKLMLGGVPYGSTFQKIDERSLAVGIYWENNYNARDLDLSAMTIHNKRIGWGGSYNSDGLVYSGDITNAPNGAVEYLLNKNSTETSMVLVNIFCGEVGCNFKVILGYQNHIDRDYMMNPNNLVVYGDYTTVKIQSMIGMFIKGEFILAPNGFNSSRVSGANLALNKFLDSENAVLEGMLNRWMNISYLNGLLTELGAVVTDTVPTEGEYTDLTLSNLSRTTLVDIFTPQSVEVV